jgi:hypothetical protein
VLETNSNQIATKNIVNARTSTILDVAYEYMIVYIANQYAKVLKMDLDKFNSFNNLSLQKVIFYPFFVATSNGNSKSLFELFSPFLAIEEGPLSIPAYNKFKNDKLIFVKFLSVRQSGITIISSNENDTFENILDELKAVVLIDSNNEKFSDIEIENDKAQNNKLYTAIESGVKTLEIQSNFKFFFGEENDIKSHSRKYEGFKNKLNLENPIIEYADIINQKEYLPFFQEMVY